MGVLGLYWNKVNVLPVHCSHLANSSTPEVFHCEIFASCLELYDWRKHCDLARLNTSHSTRIRTTPDCETSPESWTRNLLLMRNLCWKPPNESHRWPSCRGLHMPRSQRVPHFGVEGDWGHPATPRVCSSRPYTRWINYCIQKYCFVVVVDAVFVVVVLPYHCFTG